MKRDKVPASKSAPASSQEGSAARSWRPHALGLLVAVAAAAVYLDVYSHGFFVLDDDDYVNHNNLVQAGLTWRGVAWAATTNAVANWHPVTWLSHMIDCQLFGDNPHPQHMVNVLFHALNSLLVFLLLHRMSRKLWPSVFVAAVFALHPVHVESVAWIAERKDVLSTFFFLLTIWAYVACCEKPRIYVYLLMLVSYALALMAKPMVVTLPFVLLLLDYWPLGRIELNRARLRKDYKVLLGEKLPLFVLAGISSYITYAVQQKGGAVRSLDAIPMWSRFGNISVAYVHYLINTIWPAHLVVYYPHLGNKLPIWQIAGSLAILAAITIAILWRLRNQRYLVVGWLFFLGTLVPVIGLVQVGSQALADRYMYIPLIGPAIMAAWGIPALLERAPYRRLILGVASAAVLVALTTATVFQVSYWRDDVTLFERALAVTADNDFAQANLAISLNRQNRVQEAEEHFKEATALRPHYMMALVYLGIIQANQAHYDEAAKYYEQALEGMPSDPAYFDAENDLGVVRSMQGNYEEAVKHYRRAVDLRPGDADAHFNLGDALAAKGNNEEAAAQFRMALQIKPGHPKAQTALASVTAALASSPKPASVANLDLPKSAVECFRLGNSLADKQKYAEAEAAFREAVRLKPDLIDAQINLGNALAVQSKLAEAVEQFQRILKDHPASSEAHANLGNALSELGKYTEAADQFNETLRLSPGNADACCGLGFVYVKQGKLRDAADAYSRALAIDPKNAKARDTLSQIRNELNKK